jgi:hypothetical protein
MRALALMMLGIGTILAAAPVRARTYDPRYPGCLQSCLLGAVRSRVTTRRRRHAMHQREAARLSATPIHFCA